MQFDTIVRDCFAAALDAANPKQITKEAYEGLSQPPSIVIAFGKAAGAMASAIQDSGYQGTGIIITTDENHKFIDGFKCLSSSHPVPDERGLDAVLAIEEVLHELCEHDHLLLLISGGGSALLPAPALGITLRQKIALNDALLASGLDINDMNIVRRLFSRLKGGQLARLAAPAKITQFLLSDVPGDLIESIASGPAVADPVPLENAFELIYQSKIHELDFVIPHLEAIASGNIIGPVRPGDPVLNRVESHILASNVQCVNVARSHLLNYVPQINILESPVLDGDASQMGRRLAEQIIDQCKNHQYLNRPFGIVSGGETTVKIDLSNPGKGGRSQELTISFALAMHEAGLSAPSKWAILSGGTDGRDGPTDAAGGIITASEGIDKRAAENALFSHTSYDYLKTHGQLLMVGPTGTNLGDLVIIMAD